MADQKRARACDACHGIKIKCELGTTGGPTPCSRCVRLGKECIITPPKRQKDRVAELEAQVEALTKLLESQQLQTPASSSGPSEDYTATKSISSTLIPQPIPQKKRRLQEETPIENDYKQHSTEEDGIVLDTVISQEMQKYILTKYLIEIMPAFPLIPITGDCGYDALRKTRPTLLQAIIYAACPGMIPIDLQEEISRVLMNLFASAAIAEGQRSIELIQAMQLAVLWFRSPKSHGHVSVFQLAQLSAGIAEDVGLGGPQSSPSLGFPGNCEETNTIGARRTWLVSHLLSANMALLMRRPNAKAWSDYDDSCLYILEHSHLALPSDRILSQYVQAERLCEQVSSKLQYCNFSNAQDVSDPLTKNTIYDLQLSIIQWKAKVPLDLHCPTLMFLEQVAILYPHESVLHTSTNKQSFSAPFMAERLSATDFPKPFVTQEHIAAIHALKDACHALLEVFFTIDIAVVIALPAVLFTSRVAYADYILVKLYVACTAAGNTLGAYFDPESLNLEQYLNKVIRVAMRLREVDERCAPARILSCTPKLKEWYLDYKKTCAEQGTKTRPDDIDPVGSMSNVSSLPVEVLADWDSFIFDNEIGFGLDEFFADATIPNWFEEPLQNGDMHLSRRHDLVLDSFDNGMP